MTPDEIVTAAGPDPLDENPKRITFRWLWRGLNYWKAVRHVMQDELSEMRERVARLEGRGVSGDQTKNRVR